MLRMLRYLIWAVSRCVLALRYRVRLHGVEAVRRLDGPVLLLPNHPGFIDPPLVLTATFPLFGPRPLLFEGNFTGPLYPLMPLLDALRVPDLSQASAEARQKARAAIDGIKEALRQGQNVILWPAGHVQRDGAEHLGAAQTLAEVVRDVPTVKLVLLRTRGVWGSRFSWAFLGQRPAFVRRLLQGGLILLANLVVFAPRRRVDITFHEVKRDELPGLEPAQINPHLEQWYNEGGPEQPTFVRAHLLFGPRRYEFPRPAETEALDLSGLREETKRAADEMIAERAKQPVTLGELSPQTKLDELGISSLAAAELSLAVERRFRFRGETIPETVGQVYALAAGLARTAPVKPAPPAWFAPPSTEKAEILADTVAEAFVARALACRKDVVCADDQAGVMTYEKLLVGALLMARRFRELPGTNVGLLLPASVGCDVALMGLYLAGKLPVVLNWTTGEANLGHAVRVMGLGHVVTSKLFIDRTDLKVPGAELVFLEGYRETIGAMEKLTTLLRVRWLPGGVRNAVPRPSPDDPAVVLFTSGSEKAPKAVPLTHRNLLTNQRAGIEALRVSRRDAILGFLPAFHSFGMSITGLLPLLAGLHVIRHPDPMAAAALARKVGAYRPTILVGTPTFVSYILERAEPGELASLRMAVVGAEKCPPAVFDRFAQAAPTARILEGYGITECSPVVAVNPPDAPRPGTVGKPLPGVAVCVVDAEDRTRAVPAGEMGMLLVGGPSVFPGYVGHDGESPFLERDGQRWYVTGDLVRIDADGYIHFTGRLKRFLKAGGEMISLPALEEPFVQLYPPKDKKLRVAVEGVEVEGNARLVLFTTEPMTLREANELLGREGFDGVMRLDEVRRVETIPMLGTGKADYKVLRAQVLQPQPATT